MDLVAEWEVAEGLTRRLRKHHPIVIGEESLRDGFKPDHHHRGHTVLVDAVDGTRLLEHGWSDWCSAVTVFNSASREIICAVVMLANGVCYFASSERTGKCRRIGRSLDYGEISGASLETSRSAATIAFYGYRPSRLETIWNGLATLRTDLSNYRDTTSNVFIVGGNPALVRMIDGYRRIDAVIEPFGQALHDLLPGAYICGQAGATLIRSSRASTELWGTNLIKPRYQGGRVRCGRNA